MLTNEEIRQREAFLRRKRRRKWRKRIWMAKRAAVLCAFIFAICLGISKLIPKKEAPEEAQAQKPEEILAETAEDDWDEEEEEEDKGFHQKVIEKEPEMKVDLLTPNEYSRPQSALEEVKGIVIHYTGNPGTTAKQNRSYFESLKDTKQTKASSHFVVGMEGEIIQCIPSSEMSYASNDRNIDTLSIECCHKDETGEFTQETYDSLVGFVAWLCGKFNLPVDSVIRHYDVTGKECPVY